MAAVDLPADEFIQRALDDRLTIIGNAFAAEPLALYGDIMFGADNNVRRAVEFLPRKSAKLVVVLRTHGGFIEVTQRIAETIRQHFSQVVFVVPDVAYSAGTVLAMSGDAIYMDYYSRLGPIDPQVENQRGETVPALGYLRQYERLQERARNGTLTLAEAQLMIDGFDQAELYKYEQAAELSVALLKKWLVNYKFKDWTVTEGRHRKVTPKRKEQRAEEIAHKLNDTELWHSHGHGISSSVLAAELNLRIDDLAADADMSGAVKEYHTLLFDYLLKTGAGALGAVHVPGLFLQYHSHIS